MPLITSPRHRVQDIVAWEQQSRYDTRIWGTTKHKAHRAMDVIHDFAAQGDCYLGCSWGKDSTVLAHMAAHLPVTVPIVWVRVRRWENPDCEKVRDAFLEKYGDLVLYDEIEVDATAPRRWEKAQASERTSTGGFNIAKQRYGTRHISGVRAQESTTRRLTVQRNGETSENTCRPLAYWDATDVFAYLTHYDLPIHPAYAMNMGGARHRDTLRVGTLGGDRGTGMGRREWEKMYYRDIVLD